ncbi:MAG: deoxyribose-phosphate aldolase [Fuerstiella sp.]|nr:deoxyribose-phosphate aldolase [Fuerstiella sp.]
MNWDYSDISKMIDHALLKPTLKTNELEAGCLMARSYNVASVCIMPFAVKRCTELLAGSDVVPCTTIGFPHGASAIHSKVEQSRIALADGCAELDMVINISKALSGDWDYVRSEIEAVVDLAHRADGRVKVIFETCYLSNHEKIRLCEICGQLGVDWVKTSTGFGSGGATHDDLILMRRTVPKTVQVKASGGIRSLDSLLSARKIGVTRIGTSSTQAILDEVRLRLQLAPIEFVGSTGETPEY